MAMWYIGCRIDSQKKCQQFAENNYACNAAGHSSFVQEIRVGRKYVEADRVGLVFRCLTQPSSRSLGPLKCQTLASGQETTVIESYLWANNVITYHLNPGSVLVPSQTSGLEKLALYGSRGFGRSSALGTSRNARGNSHHEPSVSPQQPNPELLRPPNTRICVLTSVSTPAIHSKTTEEPIPSEKTAQKIPITQVINLASS
ncbi:hypothetical protein JG687_00007445 [Phytophthora cactorum]|uniref:Uncharacterized protein n=1 Tax=Phytophthora cactorum TaxID=29920 RepID=A0A8T1UHG2_9STRA|nr:hypothetical protein GQ600_3330 [Phytophthora cactorum]KAG6961906.1 hypothetical protein JG687_00007445 [Phytophthora cactorum]